MGKTSLSLRLRDKLGHDASEDLALAFEEAKNEMLATTQDKFEARLAMAASELRQDMAKLDGNLRVTMADGFSALRKEMSEIDANLRVAMAEGFSALRREMSGIDANLHKEMSGTDANLRKEMSGIDANLRVTMAEGFSALRRDMSEMRVDIIRMSFLFWLGQFVALVAALGYMLRGFTR